ncbi:hypothetical protein [Calidithermus chliarophilus]|uniref:hypothetical protein n=1 Tax=Calidithermus chliarophilus TaxID=52023 RepID=UPI000405023D|nr:hypothetical protein [Calidithermus chliarophilus]
MSSKADYTPEEWATLARAPFMTGLIITLASPSGITGLLGESMVVTRSIISASQSHSTDPLLMSLIEDIKNTRGKIAQPAERLTVENARPTAEATLRQVSAILAQKATPQEAAAFKEWLRDIAHDAAEAAKEGGFFGIGGVQVNEAEKAALARVAELLA